MAINTRPAPEETHGEAVGFSLAALTLAVGSLFLGGLVSQHLWEWFVVRATGWPPLGYWHAMGISLVLGYWCQPLPRKRRSDDSEPAFEMAKHQAGRVLGVLLTWGIAALVSLGVKP